VVRNLLSSGLEVISEIEFAYGFNNGKIIAITGSNGKTTTTNLCFHLLHEAGFSVAKCGNVGTSFSRQLIKDPKDWYVLELSSFQLDGIRKFRPEIAVLLNITPDHLDRYDYELDRYANSKFRIVETMGRHGLFIFNSMDPEIAYRIPGLHLKMQFQEISGRMIKEKGVVIPAEGEEIDLRNTCLIGKHNAINALAAIFVSRKLKVSLENIRIGVRTFVNDPHRLEFVDVVRGISYINDSKATNVDAVFFALEAMEQPIIWIAGGQDKGNDYSAIKELVANKVKALVCLGIDNQKLIEAFSTEVEKIGETTNVYEAVRMAASYASHGDVVLLSPACASFDLFDNYKQRGNSFKAAVNKLEENYMDT
jgi:UDP-N-acetylmuramoylalanine--D-glutamate ligase